MTDEHDVSPTADITSDITSDLAGDATDPAALADLEAEIAEANARIAEVPAEVVVTNHVMGLFQLGAIHLGNPTPNLAAASLAIDAMALLVEGLGPRLGDESVAMADALANIRMAFVNVSGR